MNHKNRSYFKVPFFYAVPALLLSGCGGTVLSSQGNSTSSKDTSSRAPVAQVIILAGQSNMEGNTWNDGLYAAIGQEKYQAYVDGFPTIKIDFSCAGGSQNSHDKFRPTCIGQGCSINQFGPEVGMAESLSKLPLTQPVFLIKYAVGGTNLYSDWRSPSSGSTGKLYTSLLLFVISALEEVENLGYAPDIRAFCWMQGESDSYVDFANFYYDRLKGFVTDVRARLASYTSYPDQVIPFVDAGISDSSVWPFYGLINSSKKKFSDENPKKNLYFSTIDAGLSYSKEPVSNPDPYHYDSTSEILLGKLFADQVTPLLS
jgi:Domain of unknown function (DUF303).